MSVRPLPCLAFICVLVAAWSVQSASYTNYQDPAGGINNNCAQCHAGFLGGFSGETHALHQEFITDCLLCHDAVGDNPPIENCAGCHVAPGLRLHHANANAPPDALGLFCATCHPGDPTPDAEDTPPPYYGQPGTLLTDPCETETSAGGEDYSGDGKGLDNDGDLDYDQDDEDCTSVPVEPTTWGSVKSVYR